MQKSLLFMLLFTVQQAMSQSVEINVVENRDTIINGSIRIIRTSPNKKEQSKVIIQSNKDSSRNSKITIIGDDLEFIDSIQKIVLEGKSPDFSFNGEFGNTDNDFLKINNDTLIIGNMIIINGDENLKDSFFINGDKFRFKWNEKDEEDEFDFNFEPGRNKKTNKEKVTTNWGIVDLGIANVNDLTNYALISGLGGYFPSGSSGDMVLVNGKSLNVNIWFFMQRVSLISNVVNLKYGLGLELNNYRFKKNIRFRDEPRYFIERDAEVASFEKNKLAADYITVPVMLNFNFTPGKSKSYGFSAGVSAGYLYSARQKMVSKERGKEKVRNDFNLQPWKLSAVAELNLGFIQLYGSYALGNMFRSGLDQTPYSAGIRFSAPE